MRGTLLLLLMAGCVGETEELDPGRKGAVDAGDAGFTDAGEEAERTEWSHLATDGSTPGPRMMASSVYDPSTDRAILFAGCRYQPDTSCLADSETWILENATGTEAGAPRWTMLDVPGPQPFRRYEHSAVYDRGDNRMIIFGATETADVWVLEHANGLGGTPEWRQIATSGDPPHPQMRGHAAAYDEDGDRMFVFGGWIFDRRLTRLGDLYVLQNVSGDATWLRVETPDPKPAARRGASAVYDPSSGRLILYGGEDNDTFFESPWILEYPEGLDAEPQWSVLELDGPNPRIEHSAIYDDAKNRMILFGGCIHTTGEQGCSASSDTWILDHANGLGGDPLWKLVLVSPTPPDRYGHGAVFNAEDDRLTVFNGEYPAGYPITGIDDVWLLRGVR